MTVSMTEQVKATRHLRKLDCVAVWPWHLRADYTASLINVVLDSSWRGRAPCHGVQICAARASTDWSSKAGGEKCIGD
jgi:hypothetical protein